MTVLVFDNGVLAADRCMMNNTSRIRTLGTKLVIDPHRYFAYAISGDEPRNETQHKNQLAVIRDVAFDLANDPTKFRNLRIKEEQDMFKDCWDVFIITKSDFIIGSPNKTLDMYEFVRQPLNTKAAAGSGGQMAKLMLLLDRPLNEVMRATATYDRFVTLEYDTIDIKKLRKIPKNFNTMLKG